MERNVQKNGLINVLVLLAIGVAGFVVARIANSLAGQISVLFTLLGLLVAVVSWFQMRLEESERLERMELEEMAKGHSTSALFEARDSEVFPAQRSREQFEKYFIPGFTVLLCLLQAGGAFALWRWVSSQELNHPLKDPITALAMFALFALVLFMLGRFSVTIARLQNDRLLRPGASYLLLNAFLCAAVALGIFGVWSGFADADFYLSYGLCALLVLVALETLVNLILELYRPRVKGKIGRPLYESRLVGLLGQPEGLITTAAQALDYQFGFKVSETWFYRFLERAVLFLVTLQVGVFLVSTCFVFIEAGEQGLKEHMGYPANQASLLGPGAHFKFPWPIDKVYRFRTEQIQTFDVGFSEDAEHESGPVLWTVAHSKEDNFLVANRDRNSTSQTNSAAGKRTPPVSLLTVSIPVEFQITDLLAWAYNNEDAPQLLQDLATREVVRYLVGVDMNDIMSHGRGEAAETLRSRIQSAADERKLGARIVSVGLGDLHPPVKVGPDYEKVVAAINTKEAKILAARADDIRTNALAEAQAVTVVNRAEAERTSRTISAVAQAGLFTNQIPAFKAAPAVYAQRAYLQTFTRSTANARKYVMLTTNTHDVLQFDLQEKFREDLLNLSTTPKK